MFIYCTKKLTLKMSIVGKRVPSEKLDMTNDARHDSNPGRRNSKGLLPLSEKTVLKIEYGSEVLLAKFNLSTSGL